MTKELKLVNIRLRFFRFHSDTKIKTLILGLVYEVYPLTRKFYAQFEQRQPPDPLRYLRHTWPEKQLERQRELVKAVPLLESQVYGWLPLQSGERATGLNFLQAPKLRCGMTVHGERLIAERITERPPFNGLRFLLH
ncbi:uncharacterized protein LOC128264706 isoform X2 [Drosophila gunungcola]|uniref:uncharacterized protein LOC128264706 isoform X2 n=1 Tax=Drosophila gunungcola TaxID=103775 RepID=UPI0022E4C68B|nr:uncharacterized protein LOC128264706 isoform X2 [Drosophila gunungcola]